MQPLDILGVNGSPRVDGNTGRALAYALGLLAEQGFSTAAVALAGKTIAPCDGCWACQQGPCVHDDDMTPIYEELRRCRFLLIATPVYMGMPTGQLKVVMDRSVALRARRSEPFALGGKHGAGIACGAFRNGGQELTLQCLHTFFLQHDMLVVSDGPRFSHSGATIVGQTDADELGKETIRNLVERVARVLRF